jgi:hypothetical protein
MLGLAQSEPLLPMHVVGFPAGVVGVGLSFGYALVLGIIRHFTAGLQFPIMAHMVADATIALLVIGLLVLGSDRNSCTCPDVVELW